MNWQSRRRAPPRFNNATSQASATLLASVLRLNIDSPQNTPPKPTP